jgi:hypothetical protein
MGTRPSKKKIIAGIGIAVGAGIVVTIAYRSIRNKGRSHLLSTINPIPISAHVCSSRKSVPALVMESENNLQSAEKVGLPLAAFQSIRLAESAAPVKRQTPTLRVATPEPDVPPVSVNPPVVPSSQAKPAIHHIPVVLSMTQRFGGALIDALIILLACCIFIGVSQTLGANVRIDSIGGIIIPCSAALIASFYAFLFQLGDRRTAGQTWLQLHLNRT